jgi:hypothetical protein
MKYRSQSVPSPLVLAPRTQDNRRPPGCQGCLIWGVALAPIYALAMMISKDVSVILVNVDPS